ncbi:hypothetical protein R1sor_013502 [Riccia sorocarpa]|uniref:Uncharacterized protein n=1 Tax=Riccia sorocarpa TaxID=122646 RepID=A0ABD3H6V3_9MARC
MTVTGDWITDRSGCEPEYSGNEEGAAKSKHTTAEERQMLEGTNERTGTNSRGPAGGKDLEAFQRRTTEDDIQQILHNMEQFNIRQNRFEEPRRELTPDWLKETQDSNTDGSLLVIPFEAGRMQGAGRGGSTVTRRATNRTGRTGRTKKKVFASKGWSTFGTDVGASAGDAIGT